MTATYPDTHTEVRTYDGVANLLTLTDEEEKVTTYAYDRENRQISVEFAGEVTSKTYDAVGNLLDLTKPKGNIRAMTYDGLNRLSTVTDDPQGLKLTTRHEYDASDNLRSQYDAKGNHVEFTYDALNRKTGHIQYKNAIGTIISCPSIQALRQESLEQPKDRSEGRQGWMNLRLKICSPRPSSNVFP